MASTSYSADGVNPMPEDSTLYLNPGFADTALWRNGLQLYQHLEIPECNDPPSPSTVAASRPSPTDLFQISENEESVSANSVVMQLLNQDEQERADLFVVYPKAKVEGNCITAFHHMFTVKLFLRDLMFSQNRIQEVPHPKAIARLLCRLSRELKSVPTFESHNLPDKFSDPADYDGCLGEMLNDIEEYIKTPDTPSLSDGYVYVRRRTETYAQCLLAAATELSPPSS